MSLNIKVDKKEGGVFVIAASGSLDSDTYTKLEEQISKVISFSPKAIILNLQGLAYIGSMGLRVILSAKKKLEENNANFAITNLQPQVKKIFDIVVALPSLNVFSSIEEADEYLLSIQRKEIEKNKDKQ